MIIIGECLDLNYAGTIFIIKLISTLTQKGRTKAERALRERLHEQQSIQGHVFKPIGFVNSR